MAQSYHKYKAAVGQISPKLGVIKENLARHIDFIEKAKKKKCSLIVFPELSLTGYNLRDLVYESAVTLNDPVISELKKASNNICVVAGFVEESEDHRFYNSSICLENGEIKYVHRKVYLPTYGMFEEMRYFSAGNSIRKFQTSLGPFGIAICEDAWHPSFIHILMMEGAQVLVVQSASPLKGVSGRETHNTEESNYWINRFYAQCYGAYVIYANLAGFEDGVCFYGHSQVIKPGGEIAATSNDFKEDLLVSEIDMSLIREARIRFPVFRDEKSELTLRELNRVFKNSL